MGVDKLLHFVFSFAIAMLDPVLSFIVGIGKEYADGMFGGVADIYDLVADWAGIVFEMLVRTAFG